jgi:aquaporin Z
MKKSMAEFLGTFTLVLLGCGTAVIAGKQVGYLGIAFAFGFALIAAAYAIGPISGCHINPAVSLGVFAARRMSGRDLFGYLVGQLLGALAGAAVLWKIASGTAAYAIGVNGLGQNGWGLGYLGEYGLGAAIVFEFVATLLFVIVILGSTQEGAPTHLAGLAIGITLTAIHILGINITGVSVNPARSFGPAVLVGGKALAQLWMFLLVPSIAGIVGGGLYRARVLALEQPKAKAVAAR